MNTFSYRLRDLDDGKTAVVEGTTEGEGRIVEIFPTAEEAASYVEELGELAATQSQGGDVPDTDTEMGLLDGLKVPSLGGWRWSDMSIAAIRLGGWRWAEEEHEYALNLVPQLLSGWRWDAKSEETGVLVKLLGGWRWDHQDDPVDSLATQIAPGLPAKDMDPHAISLKILGGWRWGLNIGKVLSGWRWGEEGN